ncbi:hypothetical protein D3C73_1446340 [compost metagenome]
MRVGSGADFHHGVFAGIFQGIVDQIGDRAGQQLAVAIGNRLGIVNSFQLYRFLFCHRFIQLQHIGHHIVE